MAQQQMLDNKVEVLKVYINAAAALGHSDIVNKKIKELESLYGLSPYSEADKNAGDAMHNKKTRESDMDLLKRFKITRE